MVESYVAIISIQICATLVTYLSLLHLTAPPVLRVILALSITVLCIFIYGAYRCSHPDFTDPFERPLFDSVPWLDGWTFTHFLLFFLVGRGIVIVNKKSVFGLLSAAFIGGILWEVFEHVAGEQRPGWMGGYGDCQMSTDKEDGKWWYGKWTDVVANGSGLLLGSYSYQMLPSVWV